MTVRGHALLWAKRSNNPDWVQDLYGEELVTAVTNRVKFAVEHFDGQVREGAGRLGSTLGRH